MKYQEACFSQRTVMSGRIGRNPTAATEGACHAFSIHWLRRVLSKSEESPRDRLAELERDGGGVNLLMQNVFLMRYIPSEVLEADRMLFRLRGLTSLRPVIPCSAYSCRRLVSTLTRTGGGFLYTFRFDEDVCGEVEEDACVHSIAFYRPSVGVEGLVYIYDPNYGEFHVKIVGFSVFWQDYVAWKYGAIYGHVLRPVVVSDKDHLGG